MAGPNFPLIDRRSLLTATAAVTTAAITPETNPDAAKAIQHPTCQKTVLKVSAGTARRLLEIGERNRLRREAGLPLLPIAHEWRRMKEWEDKEAPSEQFERFAEAHEKEIWDRVLKNRRAKERNPAWWPSRLEGMCYQREVHRTLRQLFLASVQATEKPHEQQKHGCR